MKKFVLIPIVILLTISQLTAQNYIPMAVENAQWLILEDNPETIYPDGYHMYKIMGDTIINSLTYKKVYKRVLDDVNNDWWIPYKITKEYLYGVIRDDTAKQQVFAICFYDNSNNCNKNEEYLMYDFNFSVGDTINNTLCQTRYTTVVTNIEELYSYDAYRKIINTIELDFHHSWIMEGIGSENGIFNTFSWSYWTIQDYCIGTDKECFENFLVSIKNSNAIKNNSFNAFPNPVDNTLTVELFNPGLFKGDTKLTLVNSWRTKIQEYLLNNKTTKLNFENLPGGVYFLQLFPKSGNPMVKKIIKN